jgi:hypothetical protein
MVRRAVVPLLLLCIALPARSEPPAPALTIVPKSGRQFVRLAVVGDVGRHPEAVAAAIRREHAANPLDAILLLGDNFYYCGVSSANDPLWSLIRDHYSPIGVPIFPVLGNHDYGDPTRFHGPCGTPKPDAEIGLDVVPNWRFPARSYTIAFPYGTIRMIDTMPIALDWHSPFMNSETAEQVTNGLSAALSSGRGWRIVAGHHGIYSDGLHGTQPSRDLRSMRRLLPLLKNLKVDLYVNGHDHYLGLVGDISQRPLFLTSGAGSKVEPLGTRPAGEPPTQLPPPKSTPYRGYAVLEISHDELAIEFHHESGRQRGKTYVMTGALSAVP